MPISTSDFVTTLCPDKPPCPSPWLIRSLASLKWGHCLPCHCSNHLNPFPVPAPVILALAENDCCFMKYHEMKDASGQLNRSIFRNTTFLLFFRDYFPLSLSSPHLSVHFFLWCWQFWAAHNWALPLSRSRLIALVQMMKQLLCVSSFSQVNVPTYSLPLSETQ